MAEIRNTLEAVAEAQRCLHCDKPTCIYGCPVGQDIPAFLREVGNGNFGNAYSVLIRSNPLPAICGKLCAQEKQCDDYCKVSKSQHPIDVAALEYFVAHFAYSRNLRLAPITDRSAGRAAVIGSGPTGLTVAGELARNNYDVTVFEAQSEPGGVLLYGIPEFRLKKDIVRSEVNTLFREGGVRLSANMPIGKIFTLETLFRQGFQAVFIGTGSALPKILDIPGKELPGILAATYFLRMVFLADQGLLDENEAFINTKDEVVVIGAGNTAIDAARTAARRGARLVTVVYHKSPAEMSCNAADYAQALKEGVQFKFMKQPSAYLSTKQMHTLGALRKGHDKQSNPQALAGIVLQNLEKNSEGKFVPASGQDILPCSVVILAIGQRPAAQIFDGTPGIEVNDQGFVITSEQPFGMTTRPGIFSGGDAVNGASTVVLAIADSKKVARGMMEYIKGLRAKG